MKTIKIRLDFLIGPIIKDVYDPSKNELITNISAVDNDEEIEKISLQISNLYSSYYEFDSHNQACWFNEEQEKKDKEKLLLLIKQLIDRLNEINDGSFIVEDYETERLEKL